MDLVDSYFTNKDKDMKLGGSHRGGDPQGVGRDGRVSMIEFHISLHTRMKLKESKLIMKACHLKQSS